MALVDTALKIPIPTPEDPLRTAIVPANLTVADCDMIDAVLRAYARRNEAGKKK
jgi:hypothetical protein